MCDLISASNIVPGVVSAFIYGIIYLLFYKYIYMPLINLFTFYSLAGIYEEWEKFPSQDGFITGKQNVFDTITIKTNIFFKGNILHVESENKKWEGEIEMNKLFSRSGKGFYNHKGDKNQRPAWGFIDICRKNKGTILVHRSYMFPEPIINNISEGKIEFKNRGRIESMGYIWEKI